VGQLAAYSVIPYKTPWLVLNMVLPLALSTGVLFGEVGRLTGATRAALAGIGLLLVAWTASKAVEVSFLRYDDERLGLVYVQTTREVRDLMKRIEGAAAGSPKGKGGLAIRFYTNNRWPLPWYLREYKGTLYLKEVPYDPGGDVLIFDPGQEPDVRAGLKDWRRYQRRVFTLRKNVKLVVYVRPRVSGMLESAGSTGLVP
jgi:predicted membrane-bound mannosyltransferase